MTSNQGIRNIRNNNGSAENFRSPMGTTPQAGDMQISITLSFWVAWPDRSPWSSESAPYRDRLQVE